MRRLCLLWAISFVALLPQANAGFEWLPPSQIAAPANSYEAPQTPTAVYNKMTGVPAAPVISESLGANSPALSSRLPTKNLSGKGLFIDPYPLRNQADSINQPVELSASSVEQAMIEQSMIEQARILNPLPLGASMRTGAQPKSVALPSVSTRSRKSGGYAPRAPTGGLTPMAGGEPLPLPGSSMAGAGQPAPVAATPIMQYAEAVGFGRDLPLALALSQVIPESFSHSYAAGVDTGTIVSWEGGAPWNRILENMLKPKGLTASIRGNKVTIQPLASL